MSKKITIPAGRDPLTVIINGKTYTYRAGWEYTVPDAVAAALANAAALAPQERPSGGDDTGGALPPVTEADDGKVLGVVDGAWAATDAPSGGGDVLRIPFTLTADMDTGAITGTTEASIADAAAAMEAGKTLIADSTLDFGAAGTNHFCVVMSGMIGASPVFKACASMLSDDGADLELYGILWTPAGVSVHGGKVAVSP